MGGGAGFTRTCHFAARHAHQRPDERQDPAVPLDGPCALPGAPSNHPRQGYSPMTASDKPGTNNANI